MPCLHDAIDVNKIRVIEFPIAENAKVCFCFFTDRQYSNMTYSWNDPIMLRV